MQILDNFYLIIHVYSTSVEKFTQIHMIPHSNAVGGWRRKVST